MHALRKFLALAAVCFAAPALAQNNPKHEFGVDFVVGSAKADEDGSPRVLAMTTPFDVRIGFVSRGKLMFEPRFGFSYASVGDTDDSEGFSALEFTPGLNLLFRLGSGSGLHGQMGAYITVGGGLEIERVSGEGVSETLTQPTVNAGIGARKALGSIAFRPEAFVAKVFEKDDAPGVTVIGVRLGLSFWN
jgi:hypothetical protein